MKLEDVEKLASPGPLYIDKVESAVSAPIIMAPDCWREQPRRVAKILYHSGSEDPEVDANAALFLHCCNKFKRLVDALGGLVGLHQEMAGILESVEDWDDSENRLATAQDALEKAMEVEGI